MSAFFSPSTIWVTGVVLVLLGIVTPQEGSARGPKFVPLVEQRCSIRDRKIISPVNKLYSDFFKSAVYDRSLHFRQTKFSPLKPPVVWANWNNRFPFDSLALYKNYKAGTCVGMGLYLKEHFKKELGLDFQLVTSPIPQYFGRPTYPKFGHTASVMKCADGYVLLDPSLSVPKPVVISEKEPAFVDMHSRGIWKYEVGPSGNSIKVSANSHDPQKEPWSEQRKADFSTYFPLAEIQNPDEAITAPCFFHHRKFPIFKVTALDQTLYILIINLEKVRVEFSEILPSGETNYLFAKKIEEYYKDPEAFISELLSEEQIDQLGIDKVELASRITTVLDRLKE